jgi:membrane-associated phospholipid phosphatase
MVENRYFFIGVILMAIGGALLMEWVPMGEDVLYFSERRRAWLDGLFRFVTLLGEGYVFVLAGAWYLWRGARRVTLSIAVLGGLVAVVSAVTKLFFKGDRPYAYFSKLGKLDMLVPVEGVELHRGATSFPSGHTMSAFAVYTFIALLIPRKRLMAVGLLLMALLVGVSRIYLAQHFFRDIYAGGLAGIIIAIIVYYAGFNKK